MTYSENEEHTFDHFLEKFQILDNIIWDQQSIEDTIKQVCYDLARERIDYAEIKLSIDKYVRHTNWSDEETIELLTRCFREESEKWGIKVGLVLSLKYEADRRRQKEIANLILNPDIAMHFIGIDLVGNEEFYSTDFYTPIFKTWKSAGKGLIAHVGENQSVENIQTAIEKLNVDRIAHGIKIIEDQYVIDLAKERKICFDIAITSNLYTGVVGKLEEHPVKQMLDKGLIITIGTDDPVILNTTLNKEYDLLMRCTNIKTDNIMDIMENSCKYAFTKLL